MEQLKSVAYRFSAFARRADGTLEQFRVTISQPEPSGKWDLLCCRILCPFLRAKPFTLYGADRDEALELSRRFVELSLEYRDVELVDADGARVPLPPVPQAGT